MSDRSCKDIQIYQISECCSKLRHRWRNQSHDMELKLIMYKVHCFWHSGLSPTSPPQWQNVMQYIILNLLQYVNIVITNIYIDITISECNLYYRYMYHKILISICKKIPESNINIDIRYYKQYQFSHKNTCTNNQQAKNYLLH